jgi:TatA/E family protein of Tat protein translocase
MVVIFFVALILFGPKKLPELGKTIGKALTEFRRASNDLKATFEREMHSLERETDLKSTAADINRAMFEEEVNTALLPLPREEATPEDPYSFLEANSDPYHSDAPLPPNVGASEVASAESPAATETAVAEAPVEAELAHLPGPDGTVPRTSPSVGGGQTQVG